MENLELLIGMRDTPAVRHFAVGVKFASRVEWPLTAKPSSTWITVSQMLYWPPHA